jgi:regulator of replication initiation timing
MDALKNGWSELSARVDDLMAEIRALTIINARHVVENSRLQAENLDLRRKIHKAKLRKLRGT